MTHRIPPPPGTMSRRGLLRLGGGVGAAALLGGALSGCGRAASAEPVTSGSVNLAFWTHDQAYVDFFETAAANAEAAGDSPFRWHLAPTRAGAADVVTKTIAQAIAGRGTPDVAGLEIGAFPRFLRGEIAAELLEPLEGHIDADVRDDLLPSRTAPFTKDGHLYALDSDAPLVVYYYREPEFARVGLPTDLATWDELAEAGRRAHERHGVAIGAVAVGSDLGQVVQIFDMLLMQSGGRLFDEDGTLTIETPEAERALAFLVRGVREGFITTVSDFYGPGMQAALKSGELIGQWMATWYKIYGLMPNVPEQSGQWRIRPLPVFSDGGSRTSFTGGTGFAALTGKRNTLAGVELVTSAYLTPAEQIRRFVDLGYLPTRRSVFDDPQLLEIEDEYCGGQRMFEVYREVVDEAPVFYLSADKPILDTVLSGHLLRAYHGDSSPAEALRNAAEDFRGQTRNHD
ncbi:ABC transporter substrate-binding protein [Streptomyces millisiae]|uniref:Extracellular solute-binding protein n=1 Tax=Streptomyces millisiae TaxID=3075542 RepID=A0ABU2LWL5_9ACTN|nr:extracellular solute-binding protein [Streptomyces sp. DSM 44918]MDT0321999.1 extracellular solute-binding protein [Streptomyces sp. DSM 44918]